MLQYAELSKFGQHSYVRIQRTTSNNLTEPTFNPRFFNPFTVRVFDRVL